MVPDFKTFGYFHGSLKPLPVVFTNKCCCYEWMKLSKTEAGGTQKELERVEFTRNPFQTPATQADLSSKAFTLFEIWQVL